MNEFFILRISIWLTLVHYMKHNIIRLLNDQVSLLKGNIQTLFNEELVMMEWILLVYHRWHVSSCQCIGESIDTGAWRNGTYVIALTFIDSESVSPPTNYISWC